MPDAARTPDGGWTIGRVLSWAATDFARRGLESPRLDAEVLLAHVLAVDRIRLFVDSQRPLSASELAAYRAVIRRRRDAEPVAYIRAEREFYGHRFRVDRRALIPRPDTEALVSVVLELTARRSLYGKALDLCTGSGCVAIAFSRARPSWEVTGVDTSREAIDLARENALRLGATWGLRLLAGDLYEPLAADERFDLITANPPYVPTGEIEKLDVCIREFEPRMALDGGSDGLDVTREIIRGAPERLAPDGILAVEVMAGQAESVAALFSAAGFLTVDRHTDYGGVQRAVTGRLGAGGPAGADGPP